MTIAKTVSRKQYAGDGSTTAFSFPYRFFDSGDLNVYILDAAGVETLKTLTTHYTVSNTGSESGGTVTMVTAPASGETLTILREIALTQSVDYQNNDSFPAETHEEAIDRLTLLGQQVDERIDRALTLISSDTGSTEIPYDRASKYLAFDASKNPIAAAAPEGGNVVSAFMATVLDDATASAARTTLGAVDTAQGAQLEKDVRTYYDTAGSSNAYTVVVSGVTGYTAGDVYNIRADRANTGAATLNIQGAGAKDWQNYDTAAALQAYTTGQIAAGSEFKVRYDGTRFVTVGVRYPVLTTALLEAGTSTIPGAVTSAGIKAGIAANETCLQMVSVMSGAVATGTTQMPLDDTIPQNTEGNQFMSLAITPKSASSTLVIDVTFVAGLSGATVSHMMTALFRDSTANALAVAIAAYHSSAVIKTTSFRHVVASGSTSATTFKVRAGSQGASDTVTLNGVSGARYFGGVMASSIIIREYQ